MTLGATAAIVALLIAGSGHYGAAADELPPPVWTQWRFSVDSNAPIVLDCTGTIVYSLGSTVAAYNATTSFPIWSFQPPRSTFVQSPLLTRDATRVVFNNASSNIVGLDALTGNLVWSFALPPNGTGFLQIADISSRHYIAVVMSVTPTPGSWSAPITYHVWTLVAATGAVVWHRTMRGIVTQGYISVADDGGSGFVVITFEVGGTGINSAVALLNVATGATVWNCTAGCCAGARVETPALVALLNGVGGTKTESARDLPSSVGRTRHRHVGAPEWGIIVASRTSQGADPMYYVMCRLEVATGVTQWTSNTSMFNWKPVAARNQLIFTYADQVDLSSSTPSQMITLNAVDGTERWSYNTQCNCNQQIVMGNDAAHLSNRLVYISGWQGTVLLFDEYSGENVMNWTLGLPSYDSDEQVRYFDVDLKRGVLVAHTQDTGGGSPAWRLFGAAVAAVRPAPLDHGPKNATPALWCASTGSDQGSNYYAPIVAGSTLVIPGYSDVYGINVTTGVITWTFSNDGGASYAGQALTTAVFADRSRERVAFVWMQGYNSSFVVVNTTTGNMTAELPIPQNFNSDPPIIVADATGSPSGFVFVTLQTPRQGAATLLLAIDTLAVAVAWQLVNASALYADGEAVLLQAADGTVSWIDAKNPTDPIWSCALHRCRYASSIFVYPPDNVMYIAMNAPMDSWNQPSNISAVTMGASATVLWTVTSDVSGGVVAANDRYIAYWLTGQAAYMQIANRANGIPMRTMGVSYGWGGAVQPFLLEDTIFGGSDNVFVTDILMNKLAFEVSSGVWGQLTQPIVVANKSTLFAFWKTSFCAYRLLF